MSGGRIGFAGRAIAACAAVLALGGATVQGPEAQGSVRFAVIGDIGGSVPGEPRPEIVAELVNRLKAWNPDFIVTVGDNNHTAGTDYDANVGQHFHEYIGNYKGTYGAGSPTNRFFPALGNHDYSAGITAYLNYFTLPGNERYYDFTAGAAHFFIINSQSGEPDGTTGTSQQAQWLQGAMSQSTAPWNFVFLHNSPYTSSARYGGTTGMRWSYRAWGADSVFSGHVHVCERLFVDGLRYFVAGVFGETVSGFNTPVPGSEFRYGNDYGFMVVDVGGTSTTFRFVNLAGAVVEAYTQSVAPNEWASAGGGSYNLAGNWTLGRCPSAPDAVAEFRRSLTGPVTVDSPVILGGLNLQSPGGSVLSGGAGIRLETTGPSAVITAQGGNHEIATPLQLTADTGISVLDNALTLSGALDDSRGKRLTKSGAGTLIVTGPQDYGPGTVFDILDGTVFLNTDAGAAVVLNLAVSVTNASTANLGTTQHLAALVLAGGAKANLVAGHDKVLVARALGIEEVGGVPTSRLDLTDNAMIVDYDDPAASPLQDIKRWIASGCDGRMWDGNGIVSTSAASNPLTFGLGYAQNDLLLPKDRYSIFAGQDVDLTTVLVKYTYLGDANLDGKVDDNDVTILVLNYDRGSVSTHMWHEGDVSGYDGKIDDNDITVLVLNYGAGWKPGRGGPLGGISAAVPEPATLALLVLGGLGMLVRRRRKYSALKPQLG